jgi:hypothetical protein
VPAPWITLPLLVRGGHASSCKPRAQAAETGQMGPRGRTDRHTRASTIAGLDRRDATHLRFATSETRPGERSRSIRVRGLPVMGVGSATSAAIGFGA